MIVMLERGKPSDRRLREGVEIQVQPVAVQSKPKRMQEEGVRAKSLYVAPIRPLSNEHAIGGHLAGWSYPSH